MSDGVSTATSRDGNYSSAGHQPGPIVITPIKLGCIFLPAFRTIMLSASDVGGVDFSAVCLVEAVAPARSRNRHWLDFAAFASRPV
jgi:hypothetical protein